MNTISNATIASSATQSNAVPLLLAALLGIFVIGFAGFSQMDVLHNAGHDARHSLAFPCH